MGLPARPGRGDGRLRAEPYREPGRAFPRRLPQPRRRELAQAYVGLLQGREHRRRHARPDGPQIQAGGHHQVPAEGAEVLIRIPYCVLRLRNTLYAIRDLAMKITLRIKRFNPETDKTSHWESYPVEVEPTDRVLDALHQVKWYHDGTLTLRRSCAHGICGSDAMRINGRNALACKLLIKDAGSRISVQPLLGLPIIKDLVVDMEPFFARYRSVLPYLVNDDDPGERERRQSPEDRARYDDTTKCILCAACTTSCPAFWAKGAYVGPAAIVNAHRFIYDTRDEAAEERLEILAGDDGVWRCRTIFNCTEACPRGIHITQAILEVSSAIVERRT